MSCFVAVSRRFQRSTTTLMCFYWALWPLLLMKKLTRQSFLLWKASAAFSCVSNFGSWARWQLEQVRLPLCSNRSLRTHSCQQMDGRSLATSSRSLWTSYSLCHQDPATAQLVAVALQASMGSQYQTSQAVTLACTFSCTLAACPHVTPVTHTQLQSPGWSSVHRL